MLKFSLPAFPGKRWFENNFWVQILNKEISETVSVCFNSTFNSLSLVATTARKTRLVSIIWELFSPNERNTAEAWYLELDLVMLLRGGKWIPWAWGFKDRQMLVNRIFGTISRNNRNRKNANDPWTPLRPENPMQNWGMHKLCHVCCRYSFKAVLVFFKYFFNILISK